MHLTMKFLALLLVAVLLLLGMTGCGYTRYHVTRPDGTELSVLSTRTFENGLLVKYESDKGAKLEVNAGSVSNDESTMSGALLQALLSMLPALQAAQAAQAATVAAQAPAGQ